MNDSAAADLNRDWPVPFFFGGRLCLDFINTVNSRSRPATRDYLPDSIALLGWCRQKNLFDASVIDRLETEVPGAHAPEVHARAIALREALYRIFRALIDGASVPAGDLAHLDEALRAARHHQVLAQAGSGFAWQWDAERLDLLAPLHAVALSAGALLTGDDLGRVKECPGPDGCGWLFFDETRNNSRRWCSMDHCGGAAKARRYAARQSAAGA
ncbi:CGNR zinc finger domain-containing protein [Nitratireductor soli]|uniref:CGNR zinc finger domain-containing protein n=1 Tax=Nitratireductor soli TaxID=1670619 RepID=UPI00065E786F|nr:ABATE domain-containing protein [Nitratireductor soli]